jgi:hypothetical protein
MITTEGQKDVLLNLKRKAEAANRMFSSLVEFMNDSLRVSRSEYTTQTTEIPEWLRE